MTERPDYVPRLWPMRGSNLWMAASPKRMLAWYLIVTPIPWLAAAAFYARGWIGTAILLAVAGVTMLSQAAVHAPRAWRAMRRRPRIE